MGTVIRQQNLSDVLTQHLCLLLPAFAWIISQLSENEIEPKSGYNYQVRESGGGKHNGSAINYPGCDVNILIIHIDRSQPPNHFSFICCHLLDRTFKLPVESHDIRQLADDS